MSPVMTKVSGFPSSFLKFTVVSSVFGKQFSNNDESRSLLIDWLILTTDMFEASLKSEEGTEKINIRNDGYVWSTQIKK
jgi:hypothetical protein